MGFTITETRPLAARHGWTVAEFERLAEVGFFAPDAKLELLAGEIVPKMTQNEPHSVAIVLAQTALLKIFGDGYVVRVQLPLVLGHRSRPEPDVAVVTGAPRDYLQSHPTTAVLIVEISDTTLEQDRQTKAAIYAAAGIAEYWIVNLIERTLEVRREPRPVKKEGAYRSLTILDATQSVAPLAAPDQHIAVADLLP